LAGKLQDLRRSGSTLDLPNALHFFQRAGILAADRWAEGFTAD